MYVWNIYTMYLENSSTKQEELRQNYLKIFLVVIVVIPNKFYVEIVFKKEEEKLCLVCGEFSTRFYFRTLTKCVFLFLFYF